MKLLNMVTKTLIISAFSFLLSGCFEEKMPEVNEINCQPENIKSIKNIDLRNEFAQKCLRRPNPRAGEFKPSPKVEW
ncbi:TPA: entry exclusion lipoprotein TrbK [Proteus mirabilis]|uniref:entry exclusion lipoprotein TrbK n=1 Tax=Proteus mirabilis TaxID=584 RepID=UPI00217DB194|nr:entry exclusion lipoprotein TrbK [Proteus mirabilis]MCS6748174.1 entry exclusion lipoprotein TrbK [Proteus mirabilis]HEK2843868.1 entry exclusion lipoprotein TrbK [Proteus mirabilis]